MVLAMITRDNPGGNRNGYSMSSGSMGMLGRNARQATSTPPANERRKKNGRNLSNSYQTICCAGNSSQLTITASKTAGMPIHQESATPLLSSHQITRNNAIRETRLNPICVILIDAIYTTKVLILCKVLIAIIILSPDLSIFAVKIFPVPPESVLNWRLQQLATRHFHPSPL